MTMFDVIAIIGAFAWLPFIINLIREKLRKPKLKIFPDSDLEIGYTTFGSIFNINLAFLSENKNSLIKKIELELIHQSNEITQFIWIWFEESLMQIDIPQNPISYKKNQKAIALNVNEYDLVEKKIGFQSIIFKTEINSLLKAINEDSINLRNNGKSLDELKSMQSYNNLIDHSQNAFIWKPGLYQVKFKVFLAETSKTFETVLKFQLSNLDIKTLHKNIESCKKHIEKAYINVNEEVDEKWEWITVHSFSDSEVIRISYQKEK